MGRFSALAVTLAVALCCVTGCGTSRAARSVRSAQDGRGVSVYGTWRTFGVGDGLPSASIRATFVSGDEVWVGTDLGLARREGEAWRSWTAADGLPRAPVSAIDIDASTGELWLGTLGAGAARFSGGRFDIFDQINSGLAGDQIFDLKVWGGRVWFATNTGISAFDPIRGTWDLYLERRGDQPQTVVVSLAIAAPHSAGPGEGGALYAASWCGPLLQYDEERDEWIAVEVPEVPRLSVTTVHGAAPTTSTAVAASGTALWWATQRELVRWERPGGGKPSPRALQARREGWSRGGGREGAGHDSSGLDGTWLRRAIRLPRSSAGTDDWSPPRGGPFITHLAARGASEVWVGSREGVHRLDATTTDRWLTYRRGTDGRGGVAILSKAGRIIGERRLESAPADDRVRCIAVGRDSVWIGTPNGLSVGTELVAWDSLPPGVGSARAERTDASRTGRRGAERAISSPPSRPPRASVETVRSAARMRDAAEPSSASALDTTRPAEQTHGSPRPMGDVDALFATSPSGPIRMAGETDRMRGEGHDAEGKSPAIPSESTRLAEHAAASSLLRGAAPEPEKSREATRPTRAETGPEAGTFSPTAAPPRVAIGLLAPLNKPIAIPGTDDPWPSLQVDRLAVEEAIRQVNEKGGHRGRTRVELAGTPLQFERYGWGTPEDTAALLALRPEVAGLVGIIGPTRSAPTSGGDAIDSSADGTGSQTHASPSVESALVARLELPVVNAAPTEPAIDELINPWISRCECLGTVRQARLIDPLIERIRPPRLAIVRTPGEDTRRRLAFWARRSEEQGGRVVLQTDWAPGAEEPGAVVRRLRGSRPEIVLSWADPHASASLLREMRRAGLRAIFVGSDRIVTQEFTDLIEEDVGLVLAVAPCPHEEAAAPSRFPGDLGPGRALGDPTGDREGADGSSVQEGAVAPAPSSPDREPAESLEEAPSIHDRSFLAAAHLLAAIERAGTDREAVRRALEAMNLEAVARWERGAWRIGTAGAILGDLDQKRRK